MKTHRHGTHQKALWRYLGPWGLVWLALWSGLLVWAQEERNSEKKEKAPAISQSEEGTKEEGTKEEATEIEVSVEVEAQKDPVSNPLTPSPSSKITTTTVTAQEIQAIKAKTVIEAVELAPNVHIQTQGRKYRQFAYIRGQQATLLVNGVSQGNDQRSLYTLSAGNVERIEILRDSSTLIYGPSGLNGVVNIITKEPIQPEAAWTSEYGTFGTFLGRLSAGAREQGLGYYLSVEKNKSNGPAGKNAARDMDNWHLRLSRYSQNGSRVSLTFNRDAGFIEFPIQEGVETGVLTPGWEYKPWRTTLGSLEVSQKWSPRAGTDLHVYRNSRYGVNLWPNRPTTTEKDRTEGANLRNTLRTSRRNVLRFGGQYNHWDCPTGKLFYVGRAAEEKNYALFLQDEWRGQGSRWSVDGGVRWDRTHIINESVSWGPGELIKDRWERPLLSYALGTTYQWTSSLRGSLRMGTGAVRPWDRQATQDGSTLADEKRKKYDLGFEYLPSRRWGSALTFFRVDRQNALIADGTKTVDSNVVNCYKNQDLRQNGYELEVNVWPSRALTYFAALGQTKTENRTTGETSKNFPKQTYSFGLRYRGDRIQANFSGKGVSEYESTSFLPAGSPPRKIGDYVRLDANVEYLLHPETEEKIYVIVGNITDKRYETIPTYPDFGRVVTLGYSTKYR